MSDTTITRELRAIFRQGIAKKMTLTPADQIAIQFLEALEQAEARAEKAEAENARLRERLEPQERLHSVMKEARNQMNTARRAVADAESEVDA